MSDKHRRVHEYDGAFRCLDCHSEWGELPGQPIEPDSCNAPAIDRPNVYRMTSHSPDYPDVLMVGEDVAVQTLGKLLRRWLAEQVKNTTEDGGEHGIILVFRESVAKITLERPPQDAGGLL